MDHRRSLLNEMVINEVVLFSLIQVPPISILLLLTSLFPPFLLAVRYRPLLLATRPTPLPLAMLPLPLLLGIRPIPLLLEIRPMPLPLDIRALQILPEIRPVCPVLQRGDRKTTRQKACEKIEKTQL